MLTNKDFQPPYFKIDVSPLFEHPVVSLLLHGKRVDQEKLIASAISELNFTKISELLKIQQTATLLRIVQSLYTIVVKECCQIIKIQDLSKFNIDVVIGETIRSIGPEKNVYMEFNTKGKQIEHTNGTVSILLETTIMTPPFQVDLKDIREKLEKRTESDYPHEWISVGGSPFLKNEARVFNSYNYRVPAKLCSPSSATKWETTFHRTIELSEIKDMLTNPVVENFVRTVIHHNKTGCDFPNNEELNLLLKSHPSKECVLISPDNTIVVLGDTPYDRSYGRNTQWPEETGKFLLGTKSWGFVNIGGTRRSIESSLFDSDLKTLLSNTRLDLSGSRLQKKHYFWGSEELEMRLVKKQLMGESR